MPAYPEQKTVNRKQETGRIPAFAGMAEKRRCGVLTGKKRKAMCRQDACVPTS